MNSIKICFGEENSDETYINWLEAALYRIIKGKTKFLKVDVLPKNLKTTYIKLKKNREFIVPNTSSNEYDYLLLINHITAGYLPNNVKTNISNQYGIASKSFENSDSAK